jgi:hypothetical protein
MKTTVKQQTINAVKKVLEKRRKYYISSDFPIVQMIDYYITYQGRVMNEYLRQRGYTLVKANEIDLSQIDNKKVRANRNVWITFNNYLRYKK